jgi:hypothetical protein
MKIHPNAHRTPSKRSSTDGAVTACSMATLGCIAWEHHSTTCPTVTAPAQHGRPTHCPALLACACKSHTSLSLSLNCSRPQHAPQTLNVPVHQHAPSRHTRKNNTARPAHNTCCATVGRGCRIALHSVPRADLFPTDTLKRWWCRAQWLSSHHTGAAASCNALHAP